MLNYRASPARPVGRWAVCLLAAAALCAPAPAHAQVREWLNLLMPGGYFLTSGPARSALGNPKFYSESQVLGGGIDTGVVGLQVGVRVISATSSYFPFTGGNQFELIGPSARVTTLGVSGIRPFVTGGLYVGHVKSNRQNIDKWEFAPGGAVGVEVPVAKLFKLTAQYHTNARIAGVDTDGFSLSLRF